MKKLLMLLMILGLALPVAAKPHGKTSAQPASQAQHEIQAVYNQINAAAAQSKRTKVISGKGAFHKNFQAALEQPQTKKPCLSTDVDSGRLFIARGLLPSESPMCSRRLSGIAIIVSLLLISVKRLFYYFPNYFFTGARQRERLYPARHPQARRGRWKRLPTLAASSWPG